MKKFLVKLSYTVLPLWLLLVGSVLYISLYVSPRISGDLGALACLPFGHDYDERISAHTPQDTLFQTIDTAEDLQHVRADVLTIGDSFSQQGIGSYQNYLAHSGLSVANCSWKLFSSPLQYAYNMLERGLLDSTRVKVIVVETAERLFETEVMNFMPGRAVTARPQGGGERNEWSLARARDMLLYRIGMNTAVCKARLREELFSSDDPSALYFYYDDIGNGTSLSPAGAAKARAVQAALREKAVERGLGLIWMIATDKYTVYQDFIVDNQFPRKTVIDDIDLALGRSPDLLLTKHLLLPMVVRGEKDIYLFNDSHWSYKATQALARELRKIMENELFAPTKPILNQ